MLFRSNHPCNVPSFPGLSRGEDALASVLEVFPVLPVFVADRRDRTLGDAHDILLAKALH